MADQDTLGQWLDSGGTAQGDPMGDWLASGGGESPVSATSTPPPRPWYSRALDYVPGLSSSVHTASEMGASAVAGAKDVWGLLHGQSLADLDTDGQEYIRAHTYDPAAGTPGALAVKAGSSNWNPLNWPGLAASEAGKGVNAVTGSTMAGPITEGVLDFGMSAAPFLRVGMPGEEPVPETSGPSAVQPGDVPMPLTVEEGAPRTPPTEISEGSARSPFEEPDTAEGGEELETPEQMRRGRILNEIGLQGVPFRRSALTGDPLAASTDYQLSRLDTDTGRLARSALDNERGALTRYSEGTVEGTGGRVGNTQTDTISRGEAVTGALQQLSDHYDQGIRNLYQLADSRAQGVPTDLKSFQGVLGDDSLMTNQDRVGLRSGLNAYLKKLGVVDDNGNVTASVQQAETIRKYLNDEWSPQNSKLVRNLKDALDDDVTQAAGSDVYQEARALRAQKGQVLDNPKGISQLLDTSGPSGINRAVPSDKVMGKLETMPPEQLDHILTTLRNMPPELQGAGKEALGEIQSHFAQAAHDAGNSQELQWNSKGYNQFLRNNSARLDSVFADRPDLLRRLYTTNEAGKILRFPPTYPGAAAQAINIGKSGVVSDYLHRGITMGAGAVGGWLTGGPVGAAAGSAIGEALGGKLSRAAQDAKAMKAAQSRLVGP